MTDIAPMTTTTGSKDPLVITAPLNTPVAFDQLLANSAGGASLQAQITALAARVTALEQAAGVASSTASEGGSHERHRDHTARPSSGHRHS